MSCHVFYSAAVYDEQEGLKGSTGSGKDDFRLGEALAYLANMRTFWMITVGVGECLLIFFKRNFFCVSRPCNTITCLPLTSSLLHSLLKAALPCKRPQRGLVLLYRLLYAKHPSDPVQHASLAASCHSPCQDCYPIPHDIMFQS